MNKQEISDLLTNKISSIKVAVIGDIMLDRYYFGDVHRISPEAPVPVASIVKENSCLGGAANVVNNLANLGVQVFVAGIIGKDANGESLLELMHKYDIDTSGLIIEENRPTTTKLRVLGAKQQMLRLDFEQKTPTTSLQQDYLLKWLQKLLDNGLSGVIISDYGKGLCTDSLCESVIQQARMANVPVLVDPKGHEWNKYSGADYITPNVKEIGEALGREVLNEDDSTIQAARDIMARYAIENVVVTRSEKGVSLLNSTKQLHDKATALEVFDVSGAGDTMAATFMAGIAGGLEQKSALKMANLAAGIVVGKVGTQPVLLPELLEAVRSVEREAGYEQRIVNAKQASQLIKLWQANGRKVIFTNGCFDILHIGHVSYLAAAKRLGDKLVIGLNSDSSVRRLKGETRPLVDQRARAGLLANLAAVNLVVIFDEETPEKLLSELKPDVLVKGGDYNADDVLGREFVGEVRILPFVDGYSTTDIVNRIADLVRTNKL